MKKVLALLALSFSLMAHAWEPTKPVVAIVGNTPGAGNEIAFRKLAEIVKQKHPNFNYVMENRPGADSVIAQNHFLTQPADGYTINLPSHMSTYVTNDIWEKNVKKFKYDDFVDVLTIGKSPLVLVVSTKSTVTTPEEFIRLVRITRSPINVAVGGGAHRTAFEYLMLKGNGNKDMVTPIKFNGPLPAVTSVAAYDGKEGTEFGIMPIAVARSLIESGKVRPLGFTGTRTMPQYPNVPLLKDIAPGINVYAAWSLELPKNTPQEIIDWYQKAFSEAIHSKEYKEWCDLNVVFYDESELTPKGLRKHIEELRTSFLPVLNKIDLTKE
jgi:hypothetical protein